MDLTGQYDALLADYRELQFRVTRFSAIEQQLINTRNKLDDELSYYKKLIDFNSRTAAVEDVNTYLTIAVDAFVEIFESEVVIVAIEDESSASKHCMLSEGTSITEADRDRALKALKKISTFGCSGKAFVLSKSNLRELNAYCECSRGVMYYFRSPDMKYSGYLVAMISSNNALQYTSIQVSDIPNLTLFFHAVESGIANRIKSQTISQQLAELARVNLEHKKLSLIATKTKSSVIIASAKGQIEWVNQAFTKITGYTSEEAFGKKPGDFLQGPLTDPVVTARISASLSRREAIEEVIVNYRKSSEIYYNNLEIIPIIDENGELLNFVALQKDITNEYKHKFEIEAMNSRFALIAEKSKLGMWEWEIDSQLCKWSDTLVEIFDVNRADIEHDYFGFWFSRISPEFIGPVRESIERLLGGLEEYNELELKVITGNNGTEKVIKSLTVAERDNSGRVIRLFGTNIDVTQEREFEANILRKNTELSKINHELDNFVYSVSHDLRSPLLSIKGLIDIVTVDTTLSSKGKEFLKLIGVSVSRLDENIKEILDYSRNSRLGVEFVDFNLEELIVTIFDDLRYSTGNPIEFSLNIEGAALIHSDKTRIDTVLKNIIGNAVKYLKKGATDSYVKLKVSSNDSETRITVHDNGIGMDEKTKLKVFDMFFRGTNQGAGTGLGLYICSEVIGKIGGRIEVESTLGVGTTFSIIINR